MKITYDKSADAVYMQIAKNISAAGVHKTYTCDPSEVHGEINLDFDKKNILIGIEILDASKKLPQSVLDEAEEIG